MASELETCAAAFFRIKGKDVVTEQEFKMSVSLDLKWMSMKEAEILLRKLLSEDILSKNGSYLKSASDLTNVQVPIAYRPSDGFRRSLSGDANKTLQHGAAPADVFSEMMGIAAEHGIQKGKFVSECNAIKKKLGVETCVAGLLVLRDSGADIEKLKDRVYTQVLEK